MTKKKVPSTKKKGGQAGNKNALKHGFYSKGFTPDEIKRLTGAEELDITSEIQLLRIMIDRLKDQISFDEETIVDGQANNRRDDHYLRQLNTLAMMAQSQSTMIRTHYLVKGKAGGIEDAILRALEEVRLEMGL